MYCSRLCQSTEYLFRIFSIYSNHRGHAGLEEPKFFLVRGYCDGQKHLHASAQQWDGSNHHPFSKWRLVIHRVHSSLSKISGQIYLGVQQLWLSIMLQHSGTLLLPQHLATRGPDVESQPVLCSKTIQ